MTCPVTANGPGGPHCECDNVINQGSSSGCKLMPRLYVDLVVQDFNEELLAIGFEEAETGTASGKIPKTRKQTTRTPESSPGRTRRTAGDLPAGEADRNTHFRIWLRAFGAVARSAGGARKESSAAHREQSDRGHETRISEFGYAPLAQLRGAPEARERNHLRRIENSLIEATEKTPNAQTRHSLVVFYLTQQKYADSIREFEGALKFADRSAKIHNDLGAAYFELAKTSAREKKLEALAKSLEEFTTATELDGTLLAALFNKSLALQELGLPREARESWTLYLQKDASSPWAEEARRNLTRIGNEQTRFKTDEQVLEDFLTAYRNHNDARAQKIHNETKGLLRGAAVPLQLSRRYLLAKRRGLEAEARESVEALTYIGSFEQAQSSEFFFCTSQLLRECRRG